MPHTIPDGIALDIPDLRVIITPQSEYVKYFLLSLIGSKFNSS